MTDTKEYGLFLRDIPVYGDQLLSRELNRIIEEIKAGDTLTSLIVLSNNPKERLMRTIIIGSWTESIGMLTIGLEKTKRETFNPGEGYGLTAPLDKRNFNS